MIGRPESEIAEKEKVGPAPKIRGESSYDRVTSFLMAIVLGALMIVGWLALVYVTNQAYANRITAPLQIIEVAGGGRGKPHRHFGAHREDRRARGRSLRSGVEQRRGGQRFRGAVGPGDSGRDARSG